MSSQPFSSLILREVIKEIGQIGEGIRSEDEEWAETMEGNYGLAITEQPVVLLTREQNAKTRSYLAHFKALGLDLAQRATNLIRGRHAAEIREFLKIEYGNRPPREEGQAKEDPNDFLPSDDGPTKCFEEWVALNNVWRLSLAMKEIPFEDALFGTQTCALNPLPKSWEDNLNEIMRIIDPSAVLPVPNAPGGLLTRRAFDTILPLSDSQANLTGLLDGKIIDRWFQILVSHRNWSKPGKTFFVHPDSLDVVGSSPQEVAEKATMVDPDIDLILFPTVARSKDYCMLVAIMPQAYKVLVYDTRGDAPTKVQKEEFPWIKHGLAPPAKDDVWDMLWMDCVDASGGEAACGVFMLVNALFVSLARAPVDKYTMGDLPFLRQYIAAVICKGELPDPL